MAAGIVNRIERAVRKGWDAPGLIFDLRASDWEQAEPNRMERRTWVGTYQALKDAAEEASSKKEWKEAEKEGFEHEIVDEYVNALAGWIAEEMGEHVYGTTEEGDVFLGQYEDIPSPPPPPGVLDWKPSD